MSRKVKIFYTQTSKTEQLTTSAKTWGDLKNSIEGNVKDKSCVLSRTKHTLEVDSAVLPEGDFMVYVYPKESKGGMQKRVTKKKFVKKAPAKKKVVKKAKPAKKSSKKASVSKSEKAKIDDNAAMQREAEQIGQELREAHRK